MQKKKKKKTSQIKTTNNFWNMFIKKYTTLDEFTMCWFYFFCCMLRSHICTITENVYEVYYLKQSQLSCIDSISGNCSKIQVRLCNRTKLKAKTDNVKLMI